jgi:hypothetical protein
VLGEPLTPKSSRGLEHSGTLRALRHQHPSCRFRALMASFAIMTAATDQVYSSARSIALPDLGVLVSRLLGQLSSSLPDTTDEDLNAIADDC